MSEVCLTLGDMPIRKDVEVLQVMIIHSLERGQVQSWPYNEKNEVKQSVHIIPYFYK